MYICIYVYSIYAFICKVYTHSRSIILLLINSKLSSTFEFQFSTMKVEIGVTTKHTLVLETLDVYRT